MLTSEIGIWVLFNLFVVAMLALDLGVLHRKAHAVSMKEALSWSVIWVALALAFNVWIYHWRGPEVGLQFLTGYLVERALSIDNIFVFLVVFSYFRVPAAYQHRVLVWGIVGALVMRAIFIFAGVALLERFDWLIYVFGAFLIFTGVKMATHKDEEIHPERNPMLRLFRRLMPCTDNYVDGRFFVRQAGRLLATPLAIVLLVVETTDLVFALDSIPAVLAITRDPFIVYTSNVFAILGLRALYFAVAGLMEIFHYLHYGLSAILVFVGAKMLLSDVYHLPVVASLGVVAGLLAVSMLASLVHRPATKVPAAGAPEPAGESTAG